MKCFLRSLKKSLKVSVFLISVGSSLYELFLEKLTKEMVFMSLSWGGGGGRIYSKVKEGHATSKRSLSFLL